MIKKIFIYHIIPFIIAISLNYILILSIPIINEISNRNLIINGDQKKTRGYYPNLVYKMSDSIQGEVDFISSIKSRNQLTMLGSSEFSKSPYASFNFFPDSLGVKALGVGHAGHQTLSMLCGLLAADDYIDNSKIVVFISLGWFETEGTNTKTFLEFVRPNFLKSIINNKNIDSKYKEHIGEFISSHYNEFDNPTKDMNTFKDIFLDKRRSDSIGSLEKFKNYIQGQLSTVKVKYNTKIFADTLLPGAKKNINFSLIAENAQKEFLSKITTNNIYVYDEYYEKYLYDKVAKVETHGRINDINISTNNELKDFKVLIEYLKSRNVNCSFIIQPLNPYYYGSELVKFNEVERELIKVLKANKMPYLNMHVTDKKAYNPGVLSDIMHLGNYGWMQVNSFLNNVYNEN